MAARGEGVAAWGEVMQTWGGGMAACGEGFAHGSCDFLPCTAVGAFCASDALPSKLEHGTAHAVLMMSSEKGHNRGWQSLRGDDESNSNMSSLL